MFELTLVLPNVRDIAPLPRSTDRVNFIRRRMRRTYILGPGGAPVIGYRPTQLITATPRVGRASKLGRLIHKVINDNLKAIWIWPQCHYDTVKKRFGFLKNSFPKEFLYLYEVDHTMLGMMTRSSWNLVRETVLRQFSSPNVRRRADEYSSDPNTIRAHGNAVRKRRELQRKKRKAKRALPVAPMPPPPPPPPMVVRRAMPFGSETLRMAADRRSAFSREMERNEILRRREAEYSTSESGVPTTRQPTVADPVVREVPQVEERLCWLGQDNRWHCHHALHERRPCIRYHMGGRPDDTCRECCNLEHRGRSVAPPPWKVVPGLDSKLSRPPPR